MVLNVTLSLTPTDRDLGVPSTDVGSAGTGMF